MTPSSSEARRLVTSRSRSSMAVASLPAISPAWIPFWIRTIGLPVLAAASGVKALSLEAIEHHDLAAFGSLAERHEFGERARRRRVLIERERFRVVAGLLEVAGFGDGEEVFGRGVGALGERRRLRRRRVVRSRSEAGFAPAGGDGITARKRVAREHAPSIVCRAGFEMGCGRRLTRTGEPD